MENDVAPYALVTLTTFGSFFASLTEFPIAMSAPPYSLAVGLIGVAYLPQVNLTRNQLMSSTCIYQLSCTSLIP